MQLDKDNIYQFNMIPFDAFESLILRSCHPSRSRVVSIFRHSINIFPINGKLIFTAANYNCTDKTSELATHVVNRHLLFKTNRSRKWRGLKIIM